MFNHATSSRTTIRTATTQHHSEEHNEPKHKYNARVVVQLEISFEVARKLLNRDSMIAPLKPHTKTSEVIVDTVTAR